MSGILFPVLVIFGVALVMAGVFTLLFVGLMQLPRELALAVLAIFVIALYLPRFTAPRRR